MGQGSASSGIVFAPVMSRNDETRLMKMSWQTETDPCASLLERKLRGDFGLHLASDLETAASRPARLGWRQWQIERWQSLHLCRPTTSAST